MEKQTLKTISGELRTSVEIIVENYW